jgi:hypothetical protein
LRRWRRLSLLAAGPLPPVLLLEDACDLVNFLEAAGRTVPRGRWAEEAVAAAAAAAAEAMAEQLF